ncbi:MAG: hypothetical protein HRU38_19150 [Saccharospirillaceae bacterium]|nr:hypothetical protein [Pseudomonadales bacterium]NRB80753.1 hypothetical protein [Saccharospirillaceae bacterium]
MKKIMSAVSLVVSLVVLPFSSNAKILFDINAGAGSWINPTVTGTVGGDANIDMQSANNGFAYKDDSLGYYVWADFDTIVPFVPSFRVKYQQLAYAGTGEINAGLTGQIASIDLADISGTVTSELELNYLDAIVKFGIPLPIIDINFGVNARITQMYFRAQEANLPALEANQLLVFPMGYLSASAKIPVVGIEVGGEYSTLPLGGINILDTNIYARYFIPLPSNLLFKVGIEASYHEYHLGIEQSDLLPFLNDVQSDIDFKGYSIGLTAKF